MTNDEAQAILDDLDNSDVSLTEWEIGFVEANIDRTEFSEAQKKVIAKMEEKYL